MTALTMSQTMCAVRRAGFRSLSTGRRRQAPGPPPLTMLPAVSPPSITITEPVK